MYRESFDATLMQEASRASYLRVSSRAIYHVRDAWLGGFFRETSFRLVMNVGFNVGRASFILTGRLLSHWASCRQCRGNLRDLPILLSRKMSFAKKNIKNNKTILVRREVAHLCIQCQRFLVDPVCQ